MSSEFAIEVRGLGKTYQIYQSPHDRLTQGLLNFAARHVRSERLAERLRDKARRVAHVHKALDDVTFTVRRGESLAIVGRNGSGKSTALQIICGTLALSDGTLQVTGRVAALLELGSGFNPEFTGRENVFLNGQLLGLSRRDIAQRMESIREFAGIDDFFDEPVRTYSSGMFVRLAFAVITHVDADILIIDEALAVGDAAFNQKCMRFLRNFMATGTLLFVSHDLGSVKGLCERALWLDHGKLRMDASSKEVADAYLRDLFESSQGASADSIVRPRWSPRSANCATVARRSSIAARCATTCSCNRSISTPKASVVAWHASPRLPSSTRLAGSSTRSSAANACDWRSRSRHRSR